MVFLRRKPIEATMADAELYELSPWAHQRGPELLRATEQTRHAVKEYLLRLQPLQGLENALASLKSKTPSDIAQDAERLVHCPGASGVEGTEKAYELLTAAQPMNPF
jgi:hypothetical protein